MNRVPLARFLDESTSGLVRSMTEKFWNAAQATVAGPDLSHLRMRVAMMGGWWFSWLDGTGFVEVRAERRTVIGSENRLLTLTSEGRYDCPAYPSFVREPGTLALSQLGEISSVRAWGHRFSLLTIFIPLRDMKKISGPGLLPDDRTISANYGAGSILAANLRAFTREAFSRSNTASIKPFLPDLASMIIKTFSQDPEPNADLSSAAKDKISRYIEENYMQSSLSAKQVAHACGLSERQLYRILSHSGETFLDILRRIRLERACGRLRRELGTTICEISYDCGFSSPSFFSQVFRRSYGLTPERYRQEVNTEVMA
jgi:AraC-like DNA-binding protein